MTNSLVIIPTYNEKENIAAIIQTVLHLKVTKQESFHVLVVDDGSPDGTAAIVMDMQKKYPNQVHLIQRQGKQGLGSAYLRGFAWALERGYPYICEMDADFSHNPQDLLRLRSACCYKAGMSIGSRYITGGKCENWAIDRHILSYGASMYVRLITGMPIKDPTAGFVCYTRQLLAMLDFEKIRFKGYAFQIEMKYAATKMGYQPVEVPITFKDRVIGISKMSKNIVQEAVLGVINMRLNALTKEHYNKKHTFKLRIEHTAMVE